MKKILFALLVFIIVFLIYYFNINKNIYYVSIGDSLYNYSDNVNKYYKNKIDKYIDITSNNDYRVMDLINDINYNKEFNDLKLQNILIKANYITLAIGMNDMLNKQNITYNYIDELLIDIEKLFILLRKYNKDRIDYLNFYNSINNNELIEYTNKRLEKLCKKNKINYIDISNLIDIYPTKEKNKYITNQLLNFTKK